MFLKNIFYSILKIAAMTTGILRKATSQFQISQKKVRVSLSWKVLFTWNTSRGGPNSSCLGRKQSITYKIPHILTLKKKKALQSTPATSYQHIKRREKKVVLTNLFQTFLRFKVSNSIEGDERV